MRGAWAMAWMLWATTTALGQEAKKPKAPPEPKRTPADHGPVLAVAMEGAVGGVKDTIRREDAQNYVYRGKLVSLGRERKTHCLYDVETLRVAAAWRGPYLGAASEKNMGPAIAGTMLFATRPGPGWDDGAGSFVDPRPGGEGPLPRSWLRYRGLYVSGDRVTLAYVVDGTDVLETVDAIENLSSTALVRTLRLGPSPKRRYVRLFDVAEALPPGFADGRFRSGAADYAIGVRGAPRELVRIGDRTVAAALPPMPNGGLVQLAVSASATGRHGAFDDSAEMPDPKAFTRGGPARWTETLVTRGLLGKGEKSPYAMDLIGLPEKNPWNASVRFGGHDFFPDGRIALCTWDGDVWIASGLDADLTRVAWKRFASGLQHPLGLRIVGGVVHVAGRDQITRLHDLDGDGEADFYENLNNAPGLTLQRHEYVMGLETDASGNFYFGRSGHYVKSRTDANCVVHKMSPDGERLETFARGFREPNGVCVGPDGLVTLGDNEGNGIPQTPLYRVEPGKHYGYEPAPIGSKSAGGTWKPTEKPIVWLPKPVDASAGGQTWAPAGWGPLGGQLLHTSYGNCTLMAVLVDRAGEPWQGAVWKFPFAFPSGAMRARFGPDGHLYVSGLRGWGTTGVKDGVLARVRHVGGGPPIPVAFAATKAGLAVTFSQPLDKAFAEDDQNYAGTRLATFGGKKEDLPIDAAALGPDVRTVTVSLESSAPAVNVTLQYRVRSATGVVGTGELHGTIHRLP